ncbi:sterol desaturase family protein [Nitrospirota bacterium]
MTELLITNQGPIRLGIFIGIFTLMAIYELLAPKRELTTPKISRWSTNLGLTFLNTVILRWVFPAGAVGIALFAEQNAIGIFNIRPYNIVTAGVLSFILLDMSIYVQHLIMHRVGFLWRLHMMHHTDLDLDVTSGARFHPLEIIISMLYKIIIILILGAPAWTVIIFEIALNAGAMFNHSNVSIPGWIDTPLRLTIVTPDMHRVHHSVIIKELNTNFGFFLSWWDRLFRTYTPQPSRGHKNMTIGLANHQDSKLLTLPLLIALPFTARKDTI